MTGGPAVSEARKVVTVLFTDVRGSTRLGEMLDPEPLRNVLSRYFEEMQVVVERHGGLVTKFIGDAVMARLRDPGRRTRTTRCAPSARRTRCAHGSPSSTRSSASSWGVTLEIRTGVNTGEVLAAEPSSAESVVVGDAVNVGGPARAGRASPTRSSSASDTYRLVHEAVVAEPVGPLELKGKADARPRLAPAGGDPEGTGVGPPARLAARGAHARARAARGRLPARRRRLGVRAGHRDGPGGRRASRG